MLHYVECHIYTVTIINSASTLLLSPFFSAVTAGRGVVVEIVDNGPGVPGGDLPHIFDPGYRGREPQESGIPGSGLGLGIARDTMRSMGGELIVSNEEEKGWGACVKLFLPLLQPRREREKE